MANWLNRKNMASNGYGALHDMWMIAILKTYGRLEIFYPRVEGWKYLIDLRVYELW
jgi:hypothetical protein